MRLRVILVMVLCTSISLVSAAPRPILPAIPMLLLDGDPVALAPGGVQASAGQQQVTLSWNVVSGATSYNVYYGTSANLSPANGTKLQNVSSPRAVANLVANTLYYFVVTALKAGAESAPSLKVSATPEATTTSNASIIYDFAAGDVFVNKSGWAFTDRTGDIKLVSMPGSGVTALQFPFPGSEPGTDAWTEQRFTMPPIDSFWIRFRLHIPTNYAHRFDTKIDLPAASIASWQVGDHVRGVGGVADGIISGINRVNQPDNNSGIYLRNPPLAWDNGTWVGSLLNLTRNASAVSTARAMDVTNNKVFAVWADDYSAHGLGPTVAWEMWNADTPAGVTPTSTNLTVHYSAGNHTGAGSHIDASGGSFITSADAGHYRDIVLHGQFSSTPGAKNGVIQTWVRKEGAASYTQVHNIHDADMDKRSDVAADLRSWRAGYMMGWANSGYDQTTTFYISKLEYFTSQPNGL